MVNEETGEPFTFEIMLNGPLIEKVALPFAQNLQAASASTSPSGCSIPRNM
jgi:microcin C transport system substrate-binding protein